jgi:fatty-acyl-CoA synthase
VSLDDVCIVMYTSGTTGRPKGATLTHGNITWNAINVLVDADLRADEVTLVTAPMFHTAALNMSVLPTLLKGGRVVIEPGFEPERALDLIAGEGVTCLFGVPAMYAAIMQSPRWAEADLTRVRNLLCGGAPVPEPLIRSYTDRGLSFIQGYGMTETSPGALLLDRDRAQTKLGSAGYPHFFTDVKVVRSNGVEVGVGEKGEIVVQGPNVMAGYWQNPQATASSLVDGWFRTGDVAVVDVDGAVYVVDRIKDMIISGGENVYPAEVESALHEHPAVQDCAVVGVPDEKWGEVGRAIVVLAPDARLTVGQMREFLTDRLARYKIPRSLTVVDALPRNATGKILRKDLREAAD